MRLVDYLLLTFRNLWRQKLRSALTIFAIVIGATSVTIMLALVTGAKDYFYGQFESTGQLQQVIVNKQADLDYEESQYSHGNCTDECKLLTNEIAEKIKTYPHVTGLTRTAGVFVFSHLTYKDKKLTIQNTRAYDPNGVIKDIYLAGKDFSPSDATGKIIISKAYADKMGFKDKYDQLINQQVALTTQDFFTGGGAVLPDPLKEWERCSQGGCDNNNGPQQKPTTFQASIVGVVGDESTTIYFPMKWAEPLMQSRRYEMTKADRETFDAANNAYNRNGRKGAAPVPHFTLLVQDEIARNGYDTFIVNADQTTNVDALAVQIRKLGVGAVTAQQYIKDQLKIFQIISLVLGGIGGIALLVAAIGVVNTMIMAILERTREIGVMRALGARRSTVSRLFTFEAAWLGFWGGVMGVCVGYGLTRVANVFINKQLISSADSAQNIIGLPLWLAASVIAATTVIGLLAGLYPARRAAKLDPVDALRYE